MKKKLKTALITSLIMVLALGGICFFGYRQNKKIQDAQKRLERQELDILSKDSQKEVFDERQIENTAMDTKAKDTK